MIEELLLAEKRHGRASEIASSNKDWDLSERESETALRIKNWRRTLDGLCADIIASGILQGVDETTTEAVGQRDTRDMSVTGTTETIGDTEDASLTNEPIPNEDATSFVEEHISDEDETSPSEEMIPHEDGMLVAPEDSHEAEPTGFVLFGKQHEVVNRVGMYTQICDLLVLHCPYTMSVLSIDMNLNTPHRTSFSYTQSEIKHNPQKLSNGLWIEAEGTSDHIVNMCHQLLEKCGFPQDELQVTTMEA